MELQNFSGAVLKVVQAVNAAGDQPSELARVVLTPEEMREFQASGAFTKTVSKYYGDSSTIILDNIVADREGNYISFYLNGVLVTRNSPIDPLYEALVYPAALYDSMDQTVFTKTEGTTETMLVGSGNPVDDFSMVRSGFIEMGIACRIRSSMENFASDTGEYFIGIKDDQFWTFAVTVGSLHETIKNITELYNVELHLGVDPEDASKFVAWRLVFDEQASNYVWTDVLGNPVITDSATNEAFAVTQMIQRFDFPFIRRFIGDNVEFNPAGSPLGRFKLSLIAVPKWKQYDEALNVNVIADVSEFVEPVVEPTPEPTPAP